MALSSQPSLLPERLAQVISQCATGARLSLRLSAIVVELFFEAAKFNASLALSLSRRALVAAISSAKAFHLLRLAANPASLAAFANLNSSASSITFPFLQSLDRYTNLGIYLVHNAFSLAELFAMTSFQLTSSTIQMTITAAEETVRVFDGLFGSTETSRALSAFVCLVRRELYEDPDFKLNTGSLGKIGAMGTITKCLTAYCCLQYITHERSMRQIKFIPLFEGDVDLDDEEEGGDEGLGQNFGAEDIPPQTEEAAKHLEDLLDSCDNVAALTCGGRELENNEMSDDGERVELPLEKQDLLDALKSLSIETEDDLTQSELCSKSVSYSETITTDTEDSQFSSIPNTSPHPPLRKKGLARKVQSLVMKFESFTTREKKTKDGRTSPTITRKTSRLFIESRIFSASSSIPSFPSSPLSADLSSSSSSSSKPRSLSNPELYPSHIFPNQCILKNLERYMRFASGAYGSRFMRILGIGKFWDREMEISDSHHNLQAFAAHTGIPIKDIINSSYSHHSLSSRSPLAPTMKEVIYYISLDHETKAVVLTLRGTLGLSDVLTDLTCDYAELWLERYEERKEEEHRHAIRVDVEKTSKNMWDSAINMPFIPPVREESMKSLRPKTPPASKLPNSNPGPVKSPGLASRPRSESQGSATSDSAIPRRKERQFCGYVHAGMLLSASKLSHSDSEVFQTLKQALEEHEDYGLVICGHSLGAGVGSLLALMWATELEDGRFVVSEESGLPPHRPMHCYCFGPTAVMSLEMSRKCKKLITGVVFRNDVISSLSLGLVKDFKNVAVNLSHEHGMAEDVIGRVLGLSSLSSGGSTSTSPATYEPPSPAGPKSYYSNGGSGDRDSAVIFKDEDWYWSVLKTLRADMNAEKLYPPGTMYEFSISGTSGMYELTFLFLH